MKSGQTFSNFVERSKLVDTIACMAAESDETHYDKVERDVAAALFTQHYEDLANLARARRRRSKASDTMMTEDILHESFLKLGQEKIWRDDKHFLCAASLAIRHVIVDYARRKLTAKRRHERVENPEEAGVMVEYGESPEELVAIGNLMERLEHARPRWARIVDARYFAGMTEEETANMLGVSDRTVRRDWTDAKAWLAERVA
ncbi:MAG: ECF-type sigma factor [Pseudomonadota bacterium]